MVQGASSIRDISAKPQWVLRARAIGDDLSTEDSVLFNQLASVLGDWPASNLVARRALDHAARELQALAITAAT